MTVFRSVYELVQNYSVSFRLKLFYISLRVAVSQRSVCFVIFFYTQLTWMHDFNHVQKLASQFLYRLLWNSSNCLRVHNELHDSYCCQPFAIIGQTELKISCVCCFMVCRFNSSILRKFSYCVNTNRQLDSPSRYLSLCF